MQKSRWTAKYSTLLFSRFKVARSRCCSIKPTNYARMNYSSHSQGSNGGSTNVPKFEHSASETLASWITNSLACDEHLPAFRVNGNKLKIHTKPQDFYQTLKVIQGAFNVNCTPKVHRGICLDQGRTLTIWRGGGGG